MKLVLIRDNDINEIVHVYTIRKFISVVNKELNTNFTLSELDNAINYYVEAFEGEIALDVMNLETSVDDEV